jgi:hypothetical protein
MRKLKEIPQKDGFGTEYECGLEVRGGWGTRIDKHREFINTKMGKYILLLESNIQTDLKLGKIESELSNLQKVHGEIIKYFDVHSGCDSFKFKDGAVYRVKIERSVGKATLD